MIEQISGEEERDEQLGEYEPMPIQIRAPPIVLPRPGIIGDSNSTMPATMLTYENRLSTR